MAGLEDVATRRVSPGLRDWTDDSPCCSFQLSQREGLSGGEGGLVRVPGLLSHAPAQRIAAFETCPLCVLIFEHQKFWEKFRGGHRNPGPVAMSRNFSALLDFRRLPDALSLCSSSTRVALLQSSEPPTPLAGTSRMEAGDLVGAFHERSAGRGSGSRHTETPTPGAQWIRASRFECEGRGFDVLWAHQSSGALGSHRAMM